MSAEFPIEARISAPGAKDSAAQMEAVFDVMRRGTNATKEHQQVLRDTSKDYYAKSKAIRILSRDFQLAHPALMLFSRGLSSVASVARVGMGILNTYSLLMIAMQRDDVTLEEATVKLARAQRNYTQAVRDHTAMSPEAREAAEKLSDAQYDLERAQIASKRASEQQNMQLGILAIVTIPQLLSAGIRLISNWGEITTAAKLFGPTLAVFITSGLAAATAAFVGLGAAVVGSALALGTGLGGAIKLRQELGRWPDRKEVEASVDISPVFKDLPDPIKAVAKTMMIGVSQIGEALEVALPNAIKGAAGAVSEAITKGIMNPITEKITEIGKWLKERKDEFVGWGEGVVKGIVEGVGDVISKITTPITKGFTAVGTWVTEKIAVITAWGSQFIGAIASGIKGGINIIIGFINRLIDALNTIRVEIPSWVPVFGGQTFGVNIPHVSELAEGGIVTKPTLAMIGESGPEAVIPLGGGGGRSVYIGNINITVPTSRDQAEEISRRIVVELNRYMRWA